MTPIQPEEERRRQLRLFMEITNMVSESESTRLLEEHNWDVQAAASRVLDGNTSGSRDEMPPSSAIDSHRSGPRRRRGSGDGSTRNSIPGGASARNERNVTANGSNITDRNSPSILHTVVEQVTGLTSRLVLSPIRNITGINGDIGLEEAAERFISAFKEDYGQVLPQFLSTSYKNAISQSHSTDKLLLVYLHSGNHPDSDEFCRKVLCSEGVVTFVDNEMCAWGGDIFYADAYRLSDMMMVHTYPALAILQPTSTSTTSSGEQKISAKLLDRIDGTCEVETVLEKLSRCCQQHKALIQEATARRLQEEERRNLLEQQNREYQESQRRDREREEERKKKEEEEKQKIELMKRKREQLPREPPSSAERGTTTTIKFSLPNGTKFMRRFSADNMFQHVRDYVEITLDDMEDNTIVNFELVMNYPKKHFGLDYDNSLTVKEAGLVPQAVLFVQDLDS